VGRFFELKTYRLFPVIKCTDTDYSVRLTSLTRTLSTEVSSIKSDILVLHCISRQESVKLHPLFQELLKLVDPLARYQGCDPDRVISVLNAFFADDMKECKSLVILFRHLKHVCPGRFGHEQCEIPVASSLPIFTVHCI
jgi:hypothetical protein